MLHVGKQNYVEEDEHVQHGVSEKGGGGKRKMKTKAKGLKGERKGWKGQSMQRLSLTNITSHPLCHDTPPVSLTRG